MVKFIAIDIEIVYKHKDIRKILIFLAFSSKFHYIFSRVDRSRRRKKSIKKVEHFSIATTMENYQLFHYFFHKLISHHFINIFTWLRFSVRDHALLHLLYSISIPHIKYLNICPQKSILRSLHTCCFFLSSVCERISNVSVSPNRFPLFDVLLNCYIQF